MKSEQKRYRVKLFVVPLFDLSTLITLLDCASMCTASLIAILHESLGPAPFSLPFICIFSFLLFLLSVEFDWVMETNCSLEWFNCNVRVHFIVPILIYRARFDRIDHLCFLFRNDIVSDACISNEELWIKKGKIDRKISLMDNFVSN